MRIIIMCLFTAFCFAQYTAEWTSSNLGQSGWGGAYGYDIDGDNLVELEVRSASTFTFYNGNYTSAWTISFPGYDYLNLFHPRDTDGNGMLVPLNTDNDGSGEVVISGYYYSSGYYGRFRVYDATSHAQEYESPLITGFYGNGTLEDLDGDGRDEIIIVRFGASTSESYVVVYAYTSGTEEQKGTYEVRSETRIFPNPATSDVGVAIPFEVTAEETTAPLKVSIYDASGRLVRVLIENDRAAQGRYQLVWDGRDENREAVSSGSYFIHILKNSKENVQKVNYVR